MIISNLEPCYNQNVDEFPQNLPSFHPTCYSGDENSFTYDSNLNFVDDSSNPQPPKDSYEFCGNDVHYSHDCLPHLAEYINTLSWNRPAFYNYDDDDEDYTIAIIPVLSTEEPVDSLIMEDEHLDTIPVTELDKVIKSSVEDLVPISSESEGIFDNMCDVPFRDNSLPLDILKDQFENFSDSNDDSTSIDDDYFSIYDIDYVEASPPDSELVSLEESPSPFPIPVEDSDSFFEKSDTSLSYSENSLPEFDTFSNHTKRQVVAVPLLMLITLFPSMISLSLRLSPIKKQIFDPGIFIEVQSNNFLSRDIFYISFIRDPLFLVIETLLPFSSKNEDQVFNPGILSSILLSHRGKIPFDFFESPMMIYGGNIPSLEVPFLYFYPP
nr:hypothetical protein [Tanacetum cinerariifolium]